MKFSNIFTEFCTIRTVDSQGILTDNEILDDCGYQPTESEFIKIIKENKKTKKYSGFILEVSCETLSAK